jgi:hypothetical protein
MNNFLHIRAFVDNQQSVGFVSLIPQLGFPVFSNELLRLTKRNRTHFIPSRDYLEGFHRKFARTLNINDAKVFVCVLAHI